MPGFNGERLTEIRTVRDMSMEQLANALGITKQMVSKYEDGKSIPPLEAIKKMAEVLSIPRKFLFKDSVAIKANSSTLFLRAPLATTKKTRAYARIVSVWGYEITRFIENTPQPFLSFSINERLTIPEKAMELRRQWGLGTQPIINMVTLLESRGFNVFTIKAPELKTEAYSQIVNGVPVIVLNRSVGTAVRQRFSLAHELGHMVLHSKLVDWDFDFRSKEIENEAQLFAEYFLLPEEGFRSSYLSSKTEHLIHLKKEWLVSLSAIILHCEKTGLIDAVKRDYLQKQINSRGWKKFEPLDNEIKHEVPYVIGDNISKRVTDKASFADFFDEIQLPIDSVEELCALPSGFLREFDDDSLESYDVEDFNQTEFAQLTFFDDGGDNNA